MMKTTTTGAMTTRIRSTLNVIAPVAQQFAARAGVPLPSRSTNGGESDRRLPHVDR